MPDPLDELQQIKGLSPRDAVVGRALLRNNLVDAAAVLRAAAAAATPGATGNLANAEVHVPRQRLRAPHAHALDVPQRREPRVPPEQG
jgi:hypothetical protein